MGDLLDNRSLSDHGDYLMDDVPGRTSRPKSMYEGSNLRLVNATNQVCIGCVLLAWQFGSSFIIFMNISGLIIVLNILLHY